MKTFVKIIGGLTIAIAIVIAAVFMLTGGMSNEAKALFTALKNNDSAKASTYLSKNFTDATSIEELKNYFDTSSLADYKDSSWNSRSIKNNRGKLNGIIKTESAKTIPLTLNFIKEDGKWKISAINIDNTGLNLNATDLPTADEQAELVMASMKAFSDSLDKQSMEGFRNYVSAFWRNLRDIDSFESDFSKVYPSADVFSQLITSVDPVISQEASIDDDGVLLIKGYYPSGENKLNFRQDYIREGLTWKLIQFNFQVNK